MLSISRDDIDARLALDNPWWDRGEVDAVPASTLPRRVYFEAFSNLSLNTNVNRAAILLGPRRVGKTVMTKQLVAKAIEAGFKPNNILYASIDTPLYSGLPLHYYVDSVPNAANGEKCLIIFDEIQYLKDWQVHLKDLVDSYPNVKFVASGSAAATLKLKSQESGAGRFSDFILPPLTFSEYVEFSNQQHVISIGNKLGEYFCNDIEKLNELFIDYLNYGGYPEAVFNREVRNNPDRYIYKDIVEKVLLNDLPSLYGISNIQELKKLFTVLAYNSGNETSYEAISQDAGINKQTVRKYIEYLENAFLIIRLQTVNETCRSMQRDRNFKIYLSNPSMRAALFSPVSEDNSKLIGHLAESAVFSQWQHSLAFSLLRYARWRDGEVDIVCLDKSLQKPVWMGEIKWSDRVKDNFMSETKNLRSLLSKNSNSREAFFTTKSLSIVDKMIENKNVTISPTALYCYTVGRNAARHANEILFKSSDRIDGDQEDLFKS